MRKTNNKSSYEAAWGDTIAAGTRMRAVKETATEALAAGLTEGVVKDRVKAELRRLGLDADTMAGARIPRRLRRRRLAELLRWAADALERNGADTSVGELVEEVIGATSWDEWLCDFITEWARGNEPGEMLPQFIGTVLSEKLALGEDSIPLVIAIAGPASNPRAMAEEFLDACARTLPAASWTRHRVPEVAARRCRLFAEGLTNREIADQELRHEGFDLRAVDESEYKRELRLRTTEVRVSRKRWGDHVTEIVGSV